MMLCEGEKDHSYQVEQMDLPQATRIRLEALGLTKGTKIDLLNRKRSGSVMIRVRGTRLAFGKQIARAIFIEGQAV